MDDEYDCDDLDVLTSLLEDNMDENPYDVKPDFTKFKGRKLKDGNSPKSNKSLQVDVRQCSQGDAMETARSSCTSQSKNQSSGSLDDTMEKARGSCISQNMKQSSIIDEDKSKAELLDEMQRMKERMQQLEAQIQMKEVSTDNKEVTEVNAGRKEVDLFSQAMDEEIANKNAAKKKLKEINHVKKRRIDTERMTKLSGISSEELLAYEDENDWQFSDSEQHESADDEQHESAIPTNDKTSPDSEQSENSSLFNKNKKRKAHSPNTDAVLKEKTSPYKCRLCDRQFNNFDSFNLHQFQHRKEHPFECKSCDKVFPSKLLLKTHSRTHADIHVEDQNSTPTSKSLPQSKLPQSKLSDYYQTELNQNSKRPSATSSDSSALKGHLAVKKRKIEEEVLETDAFSQIRIVNPLVSSSSFKKYIGDRKFIRLSILKSYLNGGEIEGNWVTSGVIISKTPPRTSAKGKLFSIWKMSDLRNCNETVVLFLFGKVHDEHWKTPEGSVVGILNASVLPPREKSTEETSITVDNHQKILVLGRSKDFGFCKAKKKNGQPCGNFVNKQSCEYCKFHVQTEYRKMTSKRSELQSSYSGVQPKANWKGLNKDRIMYGGKSYSLNSRETVMRKTSRSKLTLTSLGAKEAEKIKQESLKNVLVMHSKASDEQDTLVRVGGVSSEFKDLLNAPTPGAQNVLRHLVSADKCKDPVIAVSAKDLLKQHKIDMKRKVAARHEQQQARSTPGCNPGSTSIASAANGNMVDLGSPTQFYGEKNPEVCVPKLGRGFTSCNPARVKTPNSLEEAKRQAVAIIRTKGELAKTNPNKLYKGPVSEKAKQHIKQKVEKDTQPIQDKENDESPEHSQPKKRIILGQEVELSKEDIEKIAKTKSLNAHLLSQFELEMQEQYFAKMEVKEGMERMMDSVIEKEVNIVSCKQCKYTWFKASDLCKKENHQLKWHAGKQRFFTCKDCKTRCITFDRIPNKSCRHCKGTNFERASMLKERRGPLLDSEKLLLRGEERKWVNS